MKQHSGIWDRLTIVVIVAYNHLLELAIFAHLAPEILVERVKVVLQLARIHLVLGVVRRILVEVRKEDGLRVGRLDMFARTPIAVTACSDFVVERTVDLYHLSVQSTARECDATYLVLLGSEDGREIIGHSDGRCKKRGK